jgi:hypothetical protein
MSVLYLADNLVFRAGPFSATPRVEVFLITLGEILKLRPQVFELLLGKYYDVLRKSCQGLGESPPPGLLNIVRSAVVGPLTLPNVSGMETALCPHSTNPD